MLPVVKRAIEVLESVAEKYESDAKRVEAMLPSLPDSDREGWKETASDYRKRAAEYRANVEDIKEKQRGNDFIRPDRASIR